MRYLLNGSANVIDIGPAVIGTTAGTLVNPTTGLTNATVDEVGVYKHGATALTSTTGSAITHRAGGIYTLSLTTSHVDTLGRLTFYLRDDSACLPIRHEFMVLPANTYNSLVADTDNLTVDQVQLRGSSQTAIDLADFADAGYDPATNSITSMSTGPTQTIVRATWDRVLSGANHNITNSAGRRLRQVEATFVVDSGTARGGTSNTITLSTAASATDNIYRGDRVVIVGGTGQGEHDLITSYVGATRVATMAENWVITPTTNSEYELTPASVDVESWQHQVVAATTDTNRPLVASTSYPTNFGALVISTGGDLTADITGNLSGSVGSVTGAVGSVTGNVGGNVVGSVASVTATVTANVDQINGSTIPSQVLFDQLNAIQRGPVAAAAAGTITLSTSGSGAVRTANYYRGQAVLAFSTSIGGAAQIRTIISGTTALVQTVSPNWTTTPTTAYRAIVFPVPEAVTATTAMPGVDVRQLRGSSQSAIDLQDFADAGYDPTNNRLATVPTNWYAMSITTAGVVSASATVPSTQLQADVTASLVAANLDHVALTGTTTAPVAGTYLNRIMQSTSAVYNRATDSLQALRDRGDAAWTGGSSGANPANFANMQITTAGIVTANTTQIEGVDATNQLTAGVNASTAVTSRLATSAIPTNFGNLGISTAGAISTVTTNTDMRGTDSAFLAASAPTNMGNLSITTGGWVTLGTVSDPTAVPVWGTATAKEAIAWNTAFNRNRVISNSTEITLRNDANSADIATAAVTATTSSIDRAEYS